MPINPAPTIESFYKFCTERRLMGLKCRGCGKVTVPPRSACAYCGGADLAWTELSGRGKLISYTVLHFAPAQFQQMAPYAVGIVEFPENVRLMGMVRNAAFENLTVGMDLQVDFDTAVSKEWPQWPRYFFKPS
jgi:uncharacterized OB-fold protein